MFTSDSLGRVVSAVDGASAYVPGTLPDSFEWTPRLVKALSRADTALGRLDGIGTLLPNPHLLIDPFLHREAVLSSRIEGTQAGITDLYMFRVSPSEDRQQSDAREVDNYVGAMQLGLKLLSKTPLSLGLLRELHKRLMVGVRGAHGDPGNFRRNQNWIGPENCSIHEAVYVPPPVPQMKEELHELESYFHQDSELPSLVRVALIHYQFEAIHPFLDGNGRIGRLLITLWLCSQKLLSQPLLYLSAYLEPLRDTYYSLLLKVSQTGSWNRWVEFFLIGVAEQAEDAIERSSKLLQLREEFRKRFQAPGGSARMLQLVDQLFIFPYISVSLAQYLLGMKTFAGAQRVIEGVVRVGILHEITGKPRNRVYVAKEIVRAVED